MKTFVEYSHNGIDKELGSFSVIQLDGRLNRVNQIQLAKAEGQKRGYKYYRIHRTHSLRNECMNGFNLI